MTSSVRPARPGVRLWRKTLDLIFPPQCVRCQTFGKLICDFCAAKMERADPPRCEVCWTVRTGGRVCRRCAMSPPTFAGLRSAYDYGGPAREVVLALKFRGLSSIAPLMASAMAERFLEWGESVSAIVPVPLAGGRRRGRGYDQADLLAKELAHLVDVPCESRALRRSRATQAQALQPGEAARRRNVRDAFEPGERPVAGRVLLVDDVATTGATLDACARVLQSRGAQPVYALTFAREG